MSTATCKYCAKQTRKRLISWVSTSKVHAYPIDHGPRCQDHLDEAMRRRPFSTTWQWLERPLPDAY